MDAVDQKLADLEELDKLKSEVHPSLLDRVSSYIPDSVKNIGTAAYKGALGFSIPGALDAHSGSHDFSDAVLSSFGQPERPLDKTMPISRAINESGYVPKTQGERYVSEGVKGVANALTSPMGAAGPVRAALTGACGGVGGEVAGQLPGTKGTPVEPWMRVAGALVGGAVPAVGLSQATNLKELANLASGNWSPAQWAATRNNMLNAKNQIAPVDLNISQAANFPSNMDNVVEALTKHKQGAALIDQLRAQPEQVQNLAQRLRASLEGTVKEPAAIAKESQEAGSAAITAAKRFRTNQVQPHYEKAGDLPESFLQGQADNLEVQAKQAPNSTLGDSLKDLRSVFTEALGRQKGAPTGIKDQFGQDILRPEPISANEFNRSLRSFMAAKKAPNLATTPIDAETLGTLSGNLKQIRADIGDIHPDFAKGNQLYEQLSTELVDPMKASVVGRVAGRTGAKPDVEAVNKLLPIIAKGRDPESLGSEILQFAEATRNKPKVLRDAFKTHFSNAISEVEAGVAGKPSSDIAEQLKDKLFKTPKQQQGIKDSIMGMAMQAEQNPSKVYNGFLNGLKLIEAAAKRPEGLGVSANDIKGVSEKTILGSGVQLLSLNAGNQAGKGVKALITGNTYRKFAELATTPEGLDKLQELARVPVMSVKAQSILNEALATGRQIPTGIQDSNTVGNQGEQR